MTAQVISRDKLGVLTKIGQGGQGVVYRAPNVKTKFAASMVFKEYFTHTTRMDHMLPGIEPTGRAVEIPTVAIVQFQEDKLVHEHIYWDQASVLVNSSLLDPDGLPIAGAETARKVLDISLPSNTLMTPSQ